MVLHTLLTSDLLIDKLFTRRTLSKRTQKDYLAAVQCFLDRPSITPPEVSPGARNRLDDFVTTHILQAMSIHFVVSNFRSNSKDLADIW